MPATSIEAGLGDIIAKHIRKSGFVLDIVEGLTASEVNAVENALQSLALDCAKPDAHNWSHILRQAEIADDRVKIRLCKKALAKTLDIPTDRIASDTRSFEAPFEIKKRGVETKISMGAVKPNIDQTLIQNIATAQRSYAALRAGDTLADIASKHKTDLNRIAQMMPLAFLAPDLVEEIVHGKQPMIFTSQWVKRNKIPHDWDEQRQVISAL